MQKIKHWIKYHQLTAFFLITFGITFGLGFSFDAVMNRGMDFLFPITAVAICGPAFAGIIITRIGNTEPNTGSSKSTWLVFLAALAIAAFVFLLNNTIVNGAPLSLVMVIFVLVMVTPVAFVISQAFSRIPSVRNYLSSIYQVRAVWKWLLLALFLPFSLNLLSILISNLLGRQSVQVSDLSYSGLPLLTMLTITFGYQIFFFNLTGEEIGWRGFALPRLQARISPLIASLVLTFFWAVWHALYWKAMGEPVLQWDYWQETFIRLFPATLMLNWFYNRGKGSILVAGVAHATANTAFAYMPRVDWPVHTSMMYILGLILISMDRMWQKLPDDHPAVTQTPEDTPNYEAELITEQTKTG